MVAGNALRAKRAGQPWNWVNAGYIVQQLLTIYKRFLQKIPFIPPQDAKHPLGNPKNVPKGVLYLLCGSADFTYDGGDIVLAAVGAYPIDQLPDAAGRVRVADQDVPDFQAAEHLENAAAANQEFIAAN